MVRFNVVNSLSDVSLHAPEADGWKNASKSNCQGRIVLADGSRAPLNSVLPAYRIIAKKERLYSWTEYFSRLCSGFFWVGCTLGCALTNKETRQLFTKTKTLQRFAVIHPPKSAAPPKNSPKTSKKSRSFSSSKSKAFLKSTKKKRKEWEAQRKKAQALLKATALPKAWKEESLSPAERNKAEYQLTQGIQITDAMVRKIMNCHPRIMAKKKGQGITFYNSQDQHSVFSLDVAPDLIFKMQRDHVAQAVGRDNSMKARYNQMVYAKGICLKHGLNHLVVPQAALIRVPIYGKEYELLIEQKLDFDPHLSQQEEHFKGLGERLRPAVEDLTQFICLTGYNDLEPRNNPVLDVAEAEPKIGLIDIEFMKDPRSGLYGGQGQGLVNIVGLQQIERIQAVATAHKLNSEEPYQRAIASRTQQNEEDKRLAAFYTQRNIHGDEQLVANPAQLDFSQHPLNPQKQLPADVAARVQKLAKKVIKKINKEISKKSPGETVAGRRCVMIDTHSDKFSALSTTLVDKAVEQAHQARLITDEQYYRATFLGYAVQKLVDLGLVFKVKKHNAGGYLLQV
jgi:hypothetical protein